MSEMIYFGTRNDEHGHYFWSSEWSKYEGWPKIFHWGEPPVFGNKKWVWTLYRTGGYTVLSSPGSIKDRRHGTQTTFLTEGEYTFEEMWVMIAKQFPTVYGILIDKEGGQG